MNKLGFRVSVYRNADGVDCSYQGISSRVSRLTIIGHNILPELFEASDDAPAVKCIIRRSGSWSFPIIVPMDAGPNGYPYMFGGNFAYSLDSRWLEVSDQAIKIFDRIE